MSKSRKNKKMYEDIIEKDILLEEKINKRYIDIRSKINIPCNSKVVHVIKNSSKHNNGGLLLYGTYNIWKRESELLFFPINVRPFWNLNNINEIANVSFIEIDNIDYYIINGENYRENYISGGDGGGSSIGGAIVGGIIAGEVGAIIGSRKKVNSIKSKSIPVDTRRLSLQYRNYDGEKCELTFLYKDLYVFEELIPHKANNIINQLKVNECIAEQSKSSNLKRLKVLEEILNQGYITTEEYEIKKKEIINGL